ncbi:hypothetical protein [Rickettsia sp. MEAM1 (Bemisia tabaci)]|uniref:hypothetical protein n=1 Tax=Rickettsia sp. MEAM1 (Bemisia tabaci) TaxID=1182263 RepID=UPI0012FD9755|nr:hypothetical protein [Rickettsia sp. MEAM1 (Bemisia tabaci)]
MLLLFYKSFPVIAQYLIYTSLNLTVPVKVISSILECDIFSWINCYFAFTHS